MVEHNTTIDPVEKIKTPEGSQKIEAYREEKETGRRGRRKRENSGNLKKTSRLYRMFAGGAEL